MGKRQKKRTGNNKLCFQQYWGPRQVIGSLKRHVYMTSFENLQVYITGGVIMRLKIEYM